MRRHSWLLVAAMAITSPSLLAQQPQAPRDGTQEGFFRPGTGPALGTISKPLAPGATLPTPQAQPAAPVQEALVVQAREREALERELERTQRESAEREHSRAQAEAARPVAPMIVSPLDGTAPIVSPLGR